MTAVADRRLGGLPVFELPPELEASGPPESRGLTRDAVRMLVADRADGSLVDTTFSELPHMLRQGDLVIINTSGTLAAEISGTQSCSLSVVMTRGVPATGMSTSEPISPVNVRSAIWRPPSASTCPWPPASTPVSDPGPFQLV